MKERIICAAILLPESGKVYYGHRHNHCIEAMNGEMGWTLNRQQVASLKKEQGFVTTKGRYVCREEALKIALEQGQVLDVSQIRGDQLYSEDLY